MVFTSSPSSPEVCNQDAKEFSKLMVLTSSPSSPEVCNQDAKEYEVSYRDGKKYEVCNLDTKKKKKKNKGSKFPWTAPEDEMLRALVKRYGPRSWSKICKEIPDRSAKSSRLRWFNHLLPGLNLNPFTSEEDFMIIDLHRAYGTKWAKIARQMSGRSDNAIKNRWNCSLKNRQRYESPTDFGSKAHRINVVAESCKSSCKQNGESREPSKPLPKTQHCENIEAAETCKRDIELWKPPQELNLLSPGISHRGKHVFKTQQDFTGFKIDHGIDDPMTTLTL